MLDTKTFILRLVRDSSQLARNGEELSESLVLTVGIFRVTLFPKNE